MCLTTHPPPKDELVSLSEAMFVVHHLYGTVYQIFGTVMGSPVSVVVANIVMEHIENLPLRMSREPTVFWQRYMWMMFCQQYLQTRC